MSIQYQISLIREIQAKQTEIEECKSWIKRLSEDIEEYETIIESPYLPQDAYNDSQLKELKSLFKKGGVRAMNDLKGRVREDISNEIQDFKSSLEEYKENLPVAISELHEKIQELQEQLTAIALEHPKPQKEGEYQATMICSPVENLT